jgi:hypothetical protein
VEEVLGEDGVAAGGCENQDSLVGGGKVLRHDLDPSGAWICRGIGAIR